MGGVNDSVNHVSTAKNYVTVVKAGDIHRLHPHLERIGVARRLGSCEAGRGLGKIHGGGESLQIIAMDGSCWLMLWFKTNNKRQLVLG